MNSFRKSSPPLLVDIHDGFNITSGRESAVAEHLHQSDLLVLDYSLDKRNQGDGTKAIEIVRRILANDHFNLVVLHTSENLEKVFREMLVGLLAPNGALLTNDEREAMLAHIGQFEDAEPDILSRLDATLSEEHYLAFRYQGNGWPLRPPENAPPIAAFAAAAAQLGYTRFPDQKRLAHFLFSRREAVMATRMLQKPIPNLSWSIGERPWIRSDAGFIAFTAKQDKANLLDELVESLMAWRPPPSRLFLAKMRAQIDRSGVTAESTALGNKAVLARWYKTLLEADESSREYLIQESVGRHSDLLMAEILPAVSKFADEMIRADAADGAVTELCKRYFEVDFAKDSAIDNANTEHNVFVCSKKPEGHHLATGHVFYADNATWVCLTPMCDLVPGQKTKSTRYGKMAGTMPFVAVRLHSVKVTTAKDVSSNRYIFLRIDGDVKAFSLVEKEGANPHWFNLYAANEGRFKGGGFSFRRVELDSRGTLRAKPFRAEIVGQLRYEYALNFMNRLGSSMTRVGLDFLGRDDAQDGIPATAADPIPAVEAANTRRSPNVLDEAV